MFWKKNTLRVITFLLLAGTGAYGQMPNTDIFLVSFHQKDNSFSFKRPENISKRDGYDNQPSFSTDGKKIIFSSSEADSQIDVSIYDQNTGKMNTLCSTKESEFSPIMSDDGSISVVRIELDSTQRIWQYPPNSCEAKGLFTEIDSVGYYCWVGKDSVALFIVEEPSVLLFAVKDHGVKKITQNIGRCIKKVPGRNAFSFIEKISPTIWILREYNLITGKFSYIVQSMADCEDYTWLKDGTILMGNKSKIFKYKPGIDKVWVEIYDFEKYVSSITRIAVNGTEDQIVLSGIPIVK